MDCFPIIFGLFLSYALISATFFIFRFGKPTNQPPGPTPLPIIGNLYLLGDQPHKSLAKLAKTHVPIISLKLGQVNTLVISSANFAKEVLQNQDNAFLTRPVPDVLHAQHYYEYAISFLPVDTQWCTLRKIIHSNLSSKTSLQTNQYLRTEKVKELVGYCQKAGMSNESVNIGRATFRTSLNLLSNIIFSEDLTDPYNDSGKEFKDLVGNIMVEAGKPNFVDYFPILRKIDPQGIRRRMNRHFGKILGEFDELINKRLEIESRLSKNDVLDVCLKLSQDNPNEISRSHIKIFFLDMFLPGTDTTSSTIEWAMTELLRNPHVMAKAKEELEKVIGKGKIIKDDDVLKLPYLSCIINETLRLHSPLPLLLPRKTTTQVKLNEYIIPKGTQVFVNAWAIGRDPCIWEDSQEFKPKRFLTTPFDIGGQDFELISFGGGRRLCPGKPLALSMMPMVLGSLLNNFHWKLDTRIQSNDLELTERFGITIQIPTHFTLSQHR